MYVYILDSAETGIILDYTNTEEQRSSKDQPMGINVLVFCFHITVPLTERKIRTKGL